MAYEWFPWYPALYRAKTMHLSAEQDGIYRRLIDFYMDTRQPLPNNDLALARISSVAPDCWLAAAKFILPFFRVAADGCLHHSRCDAILNEQDGRNRKQSEKGKKGAKVRWEKDKQNQEVNSHGYAQAIATPMPKNATLHDMTRHDIDRDIPATPVANDFHLPAWVPKDEWDGYLQCRLEMKYDNSKITLNAMLSTLQLLNMRGSDVAQVLRNATMGRWKTLHMEKTTIHQQGNQNGTKAYSNGVPSHNGAVGSRSIHQPSRAASAGRKQILADLVRDREQARRDAEMAGKVADK